MTIQRTRTITAITAITSLTLATGLLAANAALAQDAYPSKPVTVIVPYAPGASTDIVARTVMKKAAEFLGQPILIDNKVGQAGNMGAEAAKRAAADGYNFSVMSTVHAINQSFYKGLRYSLAKDFIPVAEIGVSPTVWVVRTDLPAKSVAELVELAKREPGKLTYGAGGTSAPLEQLRATTKVDITAVPYKGVAPMMADLLGGRLDMTVASYMDVMQHVKSGQLRVIAITPSERIPELPNVPTVAETIPNFEMTIWYGVFAPVGTPEARVETMRAAVVKAMESAEVQKGLQLLAIRPVTATRAQFAARVNLEIARWSDTVRKTGMAPLE